MSQEKPFYVYVHRRATDGRVFYVGKGKGNRYKSSSVRNRHWKFVADKHGFISDIVMRFNDEQCAFSFERALIKHYGKENLCNYSDGGEGSSGVVVSEETRKKLSLAMTGKKRSDAMKAKMSKLKTGNKYSLGKTHSDESKKRMSDAQKGKIVSDDTRRKLSEANIGKKLSQETKEKMSASRQVKPVICSNGMIFSGVSDASRWLQKNGWPSALSGGISQSALGNRKTAYGFEWRYEE